MNKAKAKMQDIATEIEEKAVAVHDRLRTLIYASTMSICAIMGAVGFVTLDNMLDMTILPTWYQNIGTWMYSLVFLYWFAHLHLRLWGWAMRAENITIENPGIKECKD